MPRKHTPLTSKSQRGLFGAAYGAKKAGERRPSYVPQEVWEIDRPTLRAHLKESKRKHLPKHVKKAKKK